jgi:hypothetical protein
VIKDVQCTTMGSEIFMSSDARIKNTVDLLTCIEDITSQQMLHCILHVLITEVKFNGKDRLSP